MSYLRRFFLNFCPLSAAAQEGRHSWGWSTYLDYLRHILQVNSCVVLHVEPATVDFVIRERQCQRVKSRSNYYTDFNDPRRPVAGPDGIGNILKYEHWELEGCLYPVRCFHYRWWW